MIPAMTRTPPPPTVGARLTSTADTVLDVAERLVQTRGFNGFSYADIAAELGITKASLHYHFPTKAELGARLISRYVSSFSSALDAIDLNEQDAIRKLDRYVALYTDVLMGDRMCLCGMLAAEYTTLPTAMQVEIRRFFDVNEHWLAAVALSGRDRGELSFDGTAAALAGLLLASLEGAMLIARPYGEVARFRSAAARLLDDLRPKAGAEAAG
jgi:TetR/AcrR family transcriptional regulator, transcriptional repressor for nem operon